MIITKIVDVTISVAVVVDESKFTPEFMQHFRSYFYDFATIDDHIKHIAQMEARGILESQEGYPPLDEFGVTTTIVGQDEEIA